MTISEIHFIVCKIIALVPKNIKSGNFILSILYKQNGLFAMTSHDKILM